MKTALIVFALLMVGAFIGFVAASLCFVARRTDREPEAIARKMRVEESDRQPPRIPPKFKSKG